MTWHKLDETTGTTAADSTGNGHVGTYTGGPTLGVAAPRRFGVNFTANGRFVQAASSAMLNAIGAANADFSVSMWVKPAGLNGDWRPLIHKGAINYERCPGIWINQANNKIHFRVDTTAGTNQGADSVIAIPNNQWTHVVCVKAGNKWRCYLNGVLDTEYTLNGATVGNSGPLYIGDDPWYAGSNTSLDDVRIYSGALTVAEIETLYGHVGHWKFDEVSGTTAADSTGSGNAGTHTNGPVVNQTGAVNAAVALDGVNDYVAVAPSSSLEASHAVGVAAWFQPSASSNADRVIVNKEGEYQLAISNTREIKWAVANTSPGWAWHQTGAFVPNDRWSHVVVSYDGAAVKTYLDGALVENFAASGAIGDTFPALNQLRFGAASDSPSGKYFAGRIDEVHVYARAVTPTEVVNLHGLVGHWKFAEGAGASAADSTLNTNAASLSGGAAWLSDCAGNYAVQTTSTGGIAQTAALFTPPSTGAVAFWMQGAGIPGSVRRICGVGADWEIRQQADGKVVFDMGSDGATTVSTTEPLSVTGRWYHVAVLFNDADDSYAIYVDGKLQASGVYPNGINAQPAAAMSFGTRTGSTEYWQGALRDFRVYSRRIRPDEVAELAAIGAHWKLDETSGTVAADATGAARNASVVGTATWAAGKVGNAFQLNGSTSLVAPGLIGSPKNVTVMAWANLTTPDSGGAELISLGDCLAIRLNEGGSNSRAFFYNGSSWAGPGVSQSFTGVGWRHVAAVFNDDANTFKLYVNGVEVGSHSTSQSIGYSGLGANTVIGRHGNGQTSYDFTGKIDDARVYTRALCPAEILAIYNDGSGGGLQGVRIKRWVESR